ncbi:MAG: XylR family transcriptional regulator [Pirellulales bacterium]|nr:XylR family transcriptional regulator [Pirellulales bacterium]
MKTLRRVFVLIETNSGYSRGILEGIGQYRHEHPEWSIFFEDRSLEELPPRWLKTWRGDGIIARTANQHIRQKLNDVQIPRVELLGLQEDEPAKIHGDNRAAGRMAAAHLLGCGLRHFGVYAGGEPWWIAICREAFCEELERHGFSCSVYRPPVKDNRILPRWHESQEASLTRWLMSLPQPCGVFCINDARIVLEFCRRLSIPVPERMAILGEDEDPVVCCVSSPPLSAIDFNSKQIGYRAAVLLDRMMAGAATPEGIEWIAPLRVVPRQSTDIIAVEDAEVVQAIRFIRQYACSGIDVDDVATAACISRRALERRFRRLFDRTPKTEILRVQLEHAKVLLSKTLLSVETIARRSGFSALRRFSEVFQRETGTTPRAYRKSVSIHEIQS